MRLTDLEGKKIAILGLSVEGISTAKFLLTHGVGELTLLDKKSLGELGKEVSELASDKAIELKFGDGYLDGLTNFDVVFRTPGFPLWHPALRESGKTGVIITSQTKLFFDLCPCPIVGVTGTKGKGTTATLIYEMLKASGKDVFLGGNIGRPPLDFFDQLNQSSLVVLELSSFQLEDLGKSPHLAVVLMTTSEHLASAAPDSPNYHRSLAEYLAAKKNIVRFQKPDDLAVINADFENALKVAADGAGKKHFFSVRRGLLPGAFLHKDQLVACLGIEREVICRRDEVLLRGEHNLQNILAAVLAARLMGIDLPRVREAVKSFRGLEHRLEFVGEVGGVKYYNDSFSTTPETAVAAIKSFAEPLIVILGGSDKGSDYAELGRILGEMANLKAALLIGQMAKRIKRAADEAGGFPPKALVVGGLKDMKEIVAKAESLAALGDVVLLSPACASFDMFKNYKDRGEQFKKEVSNLSNVSNSNNTSNL